MRPTGCHLIRSFIALIFSLLAVTPWVAVAQTSSGTGADSGGASGGPIRLRQPQQPTAAPGTTATPATTIAPASGFRSDRDEPETAVRTLPGEFERYIQALAGDSSIRRFGAELVIDSQGRQATDFQAAVPADYKVSAGDELLVSIWGSVDADLRLTVDRTGRISIPRVGTVMVAGQTVPEVVGIIQRQAARVFKNFELSATLGQLRGMRVYVTGFAVRPGAYSVSGLSTLSSVLFQRAGGPASAGSFRNIELRRAGAVIARLDLYDLMLFGKRDADQLLRPDDVVHVGSVGSQVALVGSVNRAAIFEIKAGETVGDLLRMSGGFSAVADRTRLAVEPLGDRNKARIRELTLPGDAGEKLGSGDVLRAFSAVEALLPQELQNRRVRIEGEVRRPGDYILPPDTTVADALKVAGGMTSAAFIYGTEFFRESVRQNQQVNFERALRDLELEITKKGTSNTGRSNEDANNAALQLAANERFLQRLRETRPTGRVVLQLAPDAGNLPDLKLEDGDRLRIPSTPNSVGVFGSVYNSGSYLFLPQRTIGDYLRLAGDPTRGADVEGVFVVRANGSVVSAQQQRGSWLSARNTGFTTLPVLPGDTVFVPEELNKTTLLQAVKDWTQVFYQFGLGAAGIATILR